MTLKIFHKKFKLEVFKYLNLIGLNLITKTETIRFVFKIFSLTIFLNHTGKIVCMSTTRGCFFSPNKKMSKKLKIFYTQKCVTIRGAHIQ